MQQTIRTRNTLRWGEREREGGREKIRQIEGAREAEREDWSSGRRALTNSLMADVSPVL